MRCCANREGSRKENAAKREDAAAENVCKVYANGKCSAELEKLDCLVYQMSSGFVQLRLLKTWRTSCIRKLMFFPAKLMIAKSNC